MHMVDRARKLPHMVLLAALLLSVSPLATAAAQIAMEPDRPVYIAADDMHYDEEKELITAQGNVEIVQGQRIVRSSKVTYDKGRNTVYASGDVVMLEPDGNVYFAENVDLKDDLKEGVIRQFRARLSDGSLFAAASASRPKPHLTELEKAVYSPCEVCDGEDPLWQIKANEVSIDEDAERITYRHARFEVAGVPVAYAPYFAHSTPNAKRQSGLLVPTYNVSSNLGGVIEVPYYINVAPNMDATVTPIITTREGLVMSGNWRHMVSNGYYEFDGSATYPTKRDGVTGQELDGSEMRGHIEGEGRFQLSPAWQWGFAGKHASDDTYLRRYNFGNEDTLTSRVFLDGIDERSYFSAEGLAFQGLNIEDDPARTPYVLPLIDMYQESDPVWHGGRWFSGGNIMALFRDLGTESRRLSATTGWKQPYQTAGGHLFEAIMSVRADAYFVSDNGLQGSDDDVETRFIPELSVTWRYPLIRSFEHNYLVVEPIAQLVASPMGGEDMEIPNEDSRSLEFDASNLFSTSRFAGYDRIENGTRLNYGVKTSINENARRHFDVLLGQSYRVQDFDTYSLTRGDSDNLSDYVGALGLYYDALRLRYRMRLEQDSFESVRNEIDGTINLHPLSLSSYYVAFNNDPELGDREEIFASGSYALTPNWTIRAEARRDMSEGGGMIDAGGGLLFQNECVTVYTNLRREFTRDRDIEPATLLSLQVSLKNLN